MKALIVLNLTLVFLRAAHLNAADRIDFETLPDGSETTDGMVISNQYARVSPVGITFQYEDGSFPEVAKAGRPDTAFLGPPNDNTRDRAAAGQEVGISFLTSRTRPLSPLIASFSQPVASTSGFILDVDHREAWEIQACNSNSQPVASISFGRLPVPSPATGDGLATPWSFTRTTPDICSIRIIYTGTSDVGFAIDNFSPISALPAPEPASLQIDRTNNSHSLSIQGTPSAVYLIEHSDILPPTNWSSETSVVMPFSSSPLSSLTLTGLAATNATQRFYRARGLKF